MQIKISRLIWHIEPPIFFYYRFDWFLSCLSLKWNKEKFCLWKKNSKIEAHFDCGLSVHQISEKIGRHRKTKALPIERLLQPTGVKYWEKPLILKTAAKIKEKTGIQGSLATVKNVINSAEHFQTRSLKKNPHLMTQKNNFVWLS